MEETYLNRFIRALEALEQQGDVEPLARMHAPDADISNPLAQHRHKGVEGARGFWRTYRDTFQSIRSEFNHVLDNADVAFLEWTSSGTTATGQPVSYRGVSVLEFGPQGIRAFRTYFDPRRLTEKAQGPSPGAASR